MKKFWKVFGIVFAVIAVATTLGGVLWTDRFRHSEEFVSFDRAKLNEVYTALTVLDDEGKQIHEPLYLNDYKQIPLSALHDYTYMAFVAVEDKRFFSHKGIDFKRIGGAILHNLKSGGYREGASTISQQLIKNTHLNRSKTLKRKINEMMLARELEKNYTKNEILEMYLNTIYFGRNAYGIETAANVYFNKSASELTVSESAILAGMIKAPNVYAPDKNADKCRARRDTVLKLMSEQNIISQEAFAAARAEDITYSPQTARNERNYVYLVMQEACKLLNMTPLQLAKSDFVIETYCDQKLQRELQSLVSADKTLTKNGALADLSAIILNNTGGVQACLMRGDTAGANRQAGSTLKPIAVYAPALNERIITQASPVLDEETDFNGYKPTNIGGYNGWTTIKYAVAKSLNVPAVKTLNALTLPVSEKYLGKMGINGEQNLSLALGNAHGGLTVTDIAKCYATLANDGQYNDAGFIKRISCSNGTLYSRREQNTRVFQSGANYLMTDMLVNTVNAGTAKLLKKSDYSIAAKTGTVGNAQGNSDALVAAYTTQNTFCVWYSGDLPNEVNGATAPCLFASKLADVMYSANKPSKFAVPQSVIQLNIDKDSLYEDQLVLLSDDGEKFWFDKSNKPCEQAKKVTYDYKLNVNSEHNSVSISIATVPNGTWELYRQTDGRAVAVHLTDNKYACTIDCDVAFFAKLYVDGKLAYTTPVATVHYVEDTDNERSRFDPPRDGFPDLTEFWYL